jgi:hypothetical protein
MILMDRQARVGIAATTHDRTYIDEMPKYILQTPSPLQFLQHNRLSRGRGGDGAHHVVGLLPCFVPRHHETPPPSTRRRTPGVSDPSAPRKQGSRLEKQRGREGHPRVCMHPEIPPSRCKTDGDAARGIEREISSVPDSPTTTRSPPRSRGRPGFPVSPSLSSAAE